MHVANFSSHIVNCMASCCYNIFFFFLDSQGKLSEVNIVLLCVLDNISFQFLLRNPLRFVPCSRPGFDASYMDKDNVKL